jgi:hypothetical protein
MDNPYLIGTRTLPIKEQAMVRGYRVSRVSDADAATFKAEAKTLRKVLKLIQRDRQDLSWRGADYNQIYALLQCLTPIRERLRYWLAILMEDHHRIRPPVSLWDAWNKLRYSTDYETGELEYLANRNGVPAIPRIYVKE